MTHGALQPAASPQVLAALGNVQVTQDWIYTPGGAWQMKDVNVGTIDQTQQRQKIPTWAIVVAIITAWFFLLGLLFLLARETVVSGYVTVTLTNVDGRQHVEHVVVNSEAQRGAVFARVAYVQQLINHARWVESQHGGAHS